MDVIEKIRFFGDGELYLNKPLLWFPTFNAICDYSECGLYIASKHINLEKPIETTLNILINSLPNKKVEASNNGIERFFIKNKIRTLIDLKNYFKKEVREK